MYGKQSGENIAKEVYQCLEEFEISSKVIGMTTDSASNMFTCYSKLRDSLIERNGLKLKFFHNICLAHALNNIVKNEILDSLDESIDKLRTLIGKIRKSNIFIMI